MGKFIYETASGSVAIYTWTPLLSETDPGKPYAVLVQGRDDADREFASMSLQELRTMHYAIGKELARVARRNVDQARRANNRNARNAK